MNRVVHVGDDDEDGEDDSSSPAIGVDDLRSMIPESSKQLPGYAASAAKSVLLYMAVATVNLLKNSGELLGKFSGRLWTLLGELPKKIGNALSTMFHDLDAVLRWSFITLAVLTLAFSMTAFLSLNFYTSMTSQNAYNSMVNITSDMEGATLMYGQAEWYEGDCEVTRTISSVEVPCDVLSQGTDAVIDHVSEQSDVGRNQVLKDVADMGYTDSQVASLHQITMTLMPVMIALAAVSALLISSRSEDILKIFKRVGSANIVSGFILLILRPVLTLRVAELSTPSSIESSNLAVLSNNLSTVQPFQSQLLTLNAVAVFLVITGTLMLLASYYLERKYL